VKRQHPIPASPELSGPAHFGHAAAEDGVEGREVGVDGANACSNLSGDLSRLGNRLLRVGDGSPGRHVRE
jgi:hypothetical protein